MSKYCTNCGATVKLKQKLCTECGAEVFNQESNQQDLNEKNNNEFLQKPSVKEKPNEYDPNNFKGDNKESKTANLYQNGMYIIILWFIFLLYLLILGSISTHLGLDTSKNFQYTLSEYQPEIIGQATALGLIPFIIALVRKIKKKKPTQGIFIIYFTVSTISFLLAISFLLRQKEYSAISLNSDLLKKNNNAFVYNYPGNEFMIEFERKPNILSSRVQFNGVFIESEKAELSIPEYQSICRTECFNIDKSYTFNINENYVYNYLSEYSKHIGLSYPTFQYEETTLGKIGSLRAYKTLTDDDGSEIKVTYFIKQVIGENTVMIIYVGCPSEDYPTPVISRFINSVAKRNG